MQEKAKGGLTEGPILQELIKLALPIMASAFLSTEHFMCLELMAIGAISGMGIAKLCSLISIVLTGLRIPLAYASTELGVDGVWWALTISSILKGIMLHVALYWVCKKTPCGV